MAAAHWVVFIDSYYGKLLSFWWFNVGSHFTRPRSLYTAGDISKIKTTNSFINMLLPVQLSLPLFYEKTGLYLRSKLDQRKVRNDAQYLFFKLFSTSFRSTSFLFRILRKHTECRNGLKDFSSGRMERIRSQSDKFRAKGQVKRTAFPGLHSRSPTLR